LFIPSADDVSKSDGNTIRRETARTDRLGVVLDPSMRPRPRTRPTGSYRRSFRARSTSACRSHARRGRIATDLLDLARNAGAAMGSKGLIRILLTREEHEYEGAASGCKAVAPNLRLVVADDGVGMPADVAARPFQPLFTTKAATEGTGRGLSIVIAIAHGWNGNLELETAPGAGTLRFDDPNRPRPVHGRGAHA